MFTILCGAACAICIVVSALRLCRMRSLVKASPPVELIRDVGRGHDVLFQRIEALQNPVIADLLQEVFSTPNVEGAKALLNEHMLGLRSEIDSDQRVPSVLARACLALGFAAGLMQLGFAPGSSSSAISAMTSLSIGVFGASACAIMGRRADSLAKDCRASWNSLIRAVWRSLGSGDDQSRSASGEN
jgi:hypothetical protein